MRETTDEFGARGMRLWREHIQAGIRRMQERGMVRQSAEYVCYDRPVKTRTRCETCQGTGYMGGRLSVISSAGELIEHARVECPFGCEGGEHD